MYSQEFSHYRRPDTTGVVWLTPQQVDAIRLNATVNQSVSRDTVRARQIKPQVRSTTDENAEAQNILLAAPHIVAACLANGSAVKHRQPEVKPSMILKEKCARRRFTKIHRRNIAAARRGMKYKKSRNSQPATCNLQPK